MKIEWRTWETKKEETMWSTGTEINRLRDKVTMNYCENYRTEKEDPQMTKKFLKINRNLQKRK